ncbi:hypothetical protein BCAR13_440144 [Paraburkholderia caribensis]|nr:hypothetical protein BCAR13_440144 [Paraburkholderia caribensis]
MGRIYSRPIGTTAGRPRRVLRERRLATRHHAPRRSMKGSHASGVRAAPISRDDNLTCEVKLHEQVCAPSNDDGSGSS